VDETKALKKRGADVMVDIRRAAHELREHVPFTSLGVITSIVIMVVIVFSGLLPGVSQISREVFYVLHPSHVLLSAFTTTAMFMRYGGKKIWLAILIGYTGSIGIATISDSVIPYLGEILLDLPNRGIHIGFIEEPFLTNPAALLGIILGYWRWTTKFPHFGHVLISTWASLFHIIMALGSAVSTVQIVMIGIFLFFAIWLPCCTSDIIYPMLFVKKEEG
jgi:hypothetical protein